MFDQQMLRKQWTLRTDRHRIAVGDLAREGGVVERAISSIQWQDDYGRIQVVPMLIGVEGVAIPMPLEMITHLVELHNKSVEKCRV